MTQDKEERTAHMSEGMRKIHEGTKWKENNYSPSFKETDKFLMNYYLNQFN